MKHLLIFIAKAVLTLTAVLILTGCSSNKLPDEDDASPENAVQTEQERREYHIIPDFGTMADVVIELPEKAKAGETVELMTDVLFDAGIHVLVNGEEIAKSHYDSDYWGYSFVMPEGDVTVSLRPYTKAEIYGTD